MQPLQCVAGLLLSALEAAAELGRWFVGVGVLPVCGGSRGGGSNRQPQCTEPYQCASGQPWACHGPLQDKIQLVKCAAGVVKPTLGLRQGWGAGFWWGLRICRVRGLPEEETALGNHSAQSSASV